MRFIVLNSGIAWTSHAASSKNNAVAFVVSSATKTRVCSFRLLKLSTQLKHSITHTAMQNKSAPMLNSHVCSILLKVLSISSAIPAAKRAHEKPKQAGIIQLSLFSFVESCLILSTVSSSKYLYIFIITKILIKSSDSFG